MSRITVMLLTYAETMPSARHDYARATLLNLICNVYAPGHDLRFHIADNGSPPLHIEELLAMLAEHGYGDTTTVSKAPNAQGYGGSYNAATQRIHGESDYIMPVEDDWELARPLNLNPLLDAIEASEGQLRAIRLGYMGWTQKLQGEMVNFAESSFLLLDPASSEPHVAAGHPRLETVGYEVAVGPWPEGVNAGAVELAWCSRPPAREGVAWPMDLGMFASQTNESLFQHIGAVQARKDQQ